MAVKAVTESHFIQRSAVTRGSPPREAVRAQGLHIHAPPPSHVPMACTRETFGRGGGTVGIRQRSPLASSSSVQDRERHPRGSCPFLQLSFHLSLQLSLQLPPVWSRGTHEPPPCWKAGLKTLTWLASTS